MPHSQFRAPSRAPFRAPSRAQSRAQAGAEAPTEEPRVRRVRDERGVTTAEYAVATAAGAGLAGLLYTMLTGGFGEQLLRRLFDHVLALLGV